MLLRPHLLLKPDKVEWKPANLSGVALIDELDQFLMTEWDCSNKPVSNEYFILFFVLFWKEHLTGDYPFNKLLNVQCIIVD